MSNQVSVEANVRQQHLQQQRLRRKCVHDPNSSHKLSQHERTVDIVQITQPYIDKAEPLSWTSSFLVSIVANAASLVASAGNRYKEKTSIRKFFNQIFH